MSTSPAEDASDTAGFEPDDAVLYVPNHAHGDTSHADCERGVVTSTNDRYVFVRYGTALRGVATDPADLRNLQGARRAAPTVGVQENRWRCGHCGYEGPCYGNGFSAPWCKQCQKNDKLERIAGVRGGS